MADTQYIHDFNAWTKETHPNLIAQAEKMERDAAQAIETAMRMQHIAANIRRLANSVRLMGMTTEEIRAERGEAAPPMPAASPMQMPPQNNDEEEDVEAAFAAEQERRRLDYEKDAARRRGDGTPGDEQSVGG